LLGRRPFSTIVGFLLFVAIMGALDLAFAASGHDVVSLDSNERSANGLSNIAIALLQVFSAAMIMATAFIDLKRRHGEERPSIADGFLQILVNIKFYFTILLPLAIVFIAAVTGAVYLSGGPYGGDRTMVGIATFAAGGLVALVALFFTVRLFFAWPMAAADGEGKLWRAWAKSRGKFWPLLGLLILIFIVGYAPYLVSVLALNAMRSFFLPMESLSDALTPSALIEIGIISTTYGFWTFYTAAASAFLYDAADPSLASVADEF
jgi:hypothetical protein